MCDLRSLPTKRYMHEFFRVKFEGLVHFCGHCKRFGNVWYRIRAMRLTGSGHGKQSIGRPSTFDTTKTSQPFLQLLRQITTDTRSEHIGNIVIYKKPTMLLRIQSFWGRNIICDHKRFRLIYQHHFYRFTTVN